MDDIQKMTDEELIDSLIEYARRYSRLVSHRDIQSKEYAECKEILRAIQQEIDRRQAVRFTGKSGKTDS